MNTHPDVERRVNEASVKIVAGTFTTLDFQQAITEMKEAGAREELEYILECLPLRSDWDDGKVTFEMGINNVRECIEERLQTLNPTP